MPKTKPLQMTELKHTVKITERNTLFLLDGGLLCFLPRKRSNMKQINTWLEKGNYPRNAHFPAGGDDIAAYE